MLIAVEEAVPEDLMKKDRRRLFQHVRQIVTGCQQRRAIVHADAADPRHGQDTAAGSFPVHRGNSIAVVLGEVLGELVGRRSLQPQIHLGLGHPLELGNHGNRTKAAQSRFGSLCKMRQPIEQLQIALELLFDLRTEDLDSDLARAVFGVLRVARPRDGKMDLRNGCGRDGNVFEADEELLQRRAQFIGDRSTRGGSREGRETVLQFGEIRRHLFADQIGAGGEKLTQLDEARSQGHEGAGQLLAGPAVASAWHEPAQQGCQGGRHTRLLDRRQCVMARQGAGDAEQSPEHERTAQHRFAVQMRQPEWMAAIPPERFRQRARAKPAVSSFAARSACGGKRRIDSTRY